MEFHRLPVILKRYDFESKMKVCQAHSQELLSVNGLIKSEELISKPLPWDLETFALLSITSYKEYTNNKFEGVKGQKQFARIINTIKEYIPPKLKNSKENNRFLDYFLIVTGLTQFQIQENILYKIYRYSYFFNFKNNKVNMPEQFKNNFGYDYNEFINFGYLIHIMFSTELKSFPKNEILDYLINKHLHIIHCLIIDRERFISLQNEITTEISQYHYGFKYFTQYPFIRYNQKVFLPLPHLILQSVTSSLLFRLTEGNNNLRQVFGKEVLENYIHQLCKLSPYFEEVKGEYVYIHKQNQKRTLDIMLRNKQKCLLLDSKSMSPRVSLRNLTEGDIEHTINRIVEAVVQVYKHVMKFLDKEYYPFDANVKFKKTNIFGGVVLLEDSYIRRENIMAKAAKKLNIIRESEEYKYLCSNIKIFNLYELERIIFQKDDMLELLTINRQNESMWFDFSLNHTEYISEDDYIIDQPREIINVTENLQELIENFAEELVNQGILSK